MATLTVRNLDEDLVRALRIRAAERGRSAEAEHREILRVALQAKDEQDTARSQAAERPAEFRRRIAGRGSAATSDLLRMARDWRMQVLAGPDDGA